MKYLACYKSEETTISLSNNIIAPDFLSSLFYGFIFHIPFHSNYVSGSNNNNNKNVGILKV